MTLKPEVKSLLQMFAVQRIPIEEQSLEEARKAFETSAKMLSEAGKLAITENRKINGFKKDMNIRIYTPEGEGSVPRPALVYYHGGGWVIGNIETHDVLCHTLATEADCVVISVDYSLSPESKFPVAVEDSY
jgi:acetyl esterase